MQSALRENGDPITAEDSQNNLKTALLEKLNSLRAIKNYKKNNGKVMYFNLSEQSFCEMAMEEVIWRGFLESHLKSMKDKSNPSAEKDQDQECNMQAPKDKKKKQRVFVITDINYGTLKMIFRAYGLNEEMLMEMSLKQMFTKIVPYTNGKYRKEIVGEETMLKKGKIAVKYWFMNLGYRWTNNIEEMECVKMIYDMQEATIFIFCSKSYQDWFTGDFMEG